MLGWGDDPGETILLTTALASLALLLLLVLRSVVEMVVRGWRVRSRRPPYWPQD